MEAGRILPPVRLPFTIEKSRRSHSPDADQPSWGRRLGVWWDDAPEGQGVVIQGIVSTGARGNLRTGDRIVAVNGAPVSDLGALTAMLERAGTGQVLMTVRRPGMSDRSIVADLSPGGHHLEASTPGPASAGSVPTISLAESVRDYIAFILSTPVQRDLMAAGTAADPDFGCAGSGLDFSQTGVPHSIIRASILAHEKRLEDAEVESVDESDQARPTGKRRRAIVVKGRLGPTGEAVRFEYRVEELTAVRARLSLRERAGFDALEGEGDDADGS